MRHAFAMLVVLVVASGSAAATPAVVRPGANHRVGDDSFVARFGREPTESDGEPLRMHVHLTYVRDWLASREPTRPALAARRTELLGYLDDYIAKGTTPQNTYVLTRNPVFIDRDGTICAVGYLIERSIGRDVAERIAATHRLDYLEDIAAALPEVAAWIDASGFTLDELASIQPGYPGPEVMHQGGWIVDKDPPDWQDPIGTPLPKDGVYKDDAGGMVTAGAFEHGKMVGAWSVTIDGKLRGKGTFAKGRGKWTSLRADGTKLAKGAFANNRASGTWRFYHPSGRLAAKGNMDDGRRDGAWTFFYDNARSSKLSVGTFGDGETLGGWKHYDEDGQLVATATGRAWVGLAINIEPGATGVRHAVHQGIPASDDRLDGLFRGSDRLYVTEDGEMYDGTGHALEQTETGAWLRRACKWSNKRKAAAKRGDVTTLHAMLMRADGDGCNGKPLAVSKARSKRIEALLAGRMKMHAPKPVFDIDPHPPATPDPDAAAAEPDDTAVEEPPPPPRGHPDDLATYLAETMTWYIEWPHVDDSFRAVYATLPGYSMPPMNFD